MGILSLNAFRVADSAIDASTTGAAGTALASSCSVAAGLAHVIAGPVRPSDDTGASGASNNVRNSPTVRLDSRICCTTCFKKSCMRALTRIYYQSFYQ